MLVLHLLKALLFMKHRNSHLAAFTILELTISMLISAILIGITYAAYTIMSHAYLGFNDKHKAMGMLVQIDHLIKKDFEQSDHILWKNNELLFKDSDNVISYQFTPNYIIRHSLIT